MNLLTLNYVWLFYHTVWLFYHTLIILSYIKKAGRLISAGIPQSR